MKILLIGTGAVGSVICKYLSEDKDISEIICASNDIERAKEFIDINHPKIKLIRLDAGDINQVIETAQGVDLIINASLARFNENVMEAALRVGANYQDLNSYLADLKTPEQLKFHKKFQEKKLIGLISTGVGPGISNLLAAEADDVFDEINTIKIRFLEEQKTSEFIFAWSPETTLKTVAAPPLVYLDNKFIFSKPFGDGEEYKFPHPFGKKRVFSFYGDEVSTIPLFIKAKNVDFKSSGADIELFKVLFGLGLLNKKPIIFQGKKIVPFDFFSAIVPNIPTPKAMFKLIEEGTIENAFLVLVVEAVGKQSGKGIKVRNIAIFPDLKGVSKIIPGATYISYPTGTAAYIFSKFISKIGAYGVFPPEALSSKIRKEILIELEHKEIIINQEFSKV